MSHTQHTTQPAPQMTAHHRQWQGTTDGTPWMHRALIRSLAWTGLPFFYAVMALVVPFYMLCNHQGYISQYHFFRRRLRHSPLRSVVDVYANHFRFGQIIIDRFACYGGRRFKLIGDGDERFAALCDEPGGFMQIGTHVGNFELAGYMLSQEKKRIHAIVFGGEKSTVMENRMRLFARQNLRLILANGGIDHVFEMNRALADGDIVSINGDRIFGSQKTVAARILGAEAQLPLGPYILAALREVPVLCTFVMKETTDTYHLYVRELLLTPQQKALPPRRRAAALAQAYGDHLTDILRRYPHQWLNYYEFWGDN